MIKLRAWDTKEKRMIYSEDAIISIADGADWDLMSLVWFLDCLQDDDGIKEGRWIIMQYTGLKDKNNNKIYVGDIIKLFGWQQYGKEIEYQAEIKVEDGRFAMIDKYGNRNDSWPWDYVPDGCEIISNIYEKNKP